MGEINLVCPGCAAEYRVPESAIPSEGREVECSNCGRVWLAEPTRMKAPPLDLATLARSRTAPEAPPPAEAPPTAPADSPSQLSRRLPETVFNILRDEVEHEKRARAATPAPAPTSHARQTEAEADWPATTVITPGRKGLARPALAALTEPPATSGPPPALIETKAPSLPQPSPQPPSRPAREDRPAPRRETEGRAPSTAQDEAYHDPGLRSPTPVRPATANKPKPAEPRALPADPPRQPAPRTSAASYRRGILVALLLMSVLLALYAAAPQLAERGGAGARLIVLREGIDEARLWLQDRAAGLLR